MGDESVWSSMVPGVVIRRRPCGRHLPRHPTAYFIDSHWTSQKADDPYKFDPYDHYQKPGTHKFCQTFSMMHLLDELPTRETKSRYQKYDSSARRFIQMVIEKLPENHPGFMYSERASLRRVSFKLFQDILQNE
jgi:hypothetical protein